MRIRSVVAFVVLLWLILLPVHARDEAWHPATAEALAGIIGDRRMVVLGEMHGTREIPLLAGDLAERLGRGVPLLLAIEIHASEHAALSAYLDGSGDPASRERLRRRAYWSVPQARNDGRRSEDMLDLVERVRQLRAQGRDVAILPFDMADGVSRGAHWRDRAMARQLRRAWAALPHGRMLVLTGNVHAMRRKPAYAPAGMQVPMTADLQDLEPLSIVIAAASGAFWACRTPMTCGPIQVAGVLKAGVHGDDGVFHHRIVLPRFTPARAVGEVD